jgi:ABC-2 type transport system ATP-binding protein
MSFDMTQPFIRTPEDGIAIRASNLQKTYAGSVPKTALHDVSLDIPVGSIFGLLGPNGAGKSTFINILAGTVVKSAGTVSVWGADIDGNPRQARANIGIVPQELNIDAYFTPRETLEMQAGLFGVPASERRSDSILELVGLSEQAHTYARRLSGGMRRRLLVAKAMVHSPPVLVLDEPTAGVDVALRQQLWDNVRALNTAGVTIILTTHYLEEAEALCDQIAILDRGQLITNKSKADLMATASRKELHLGVRGTIPDPLPDELVQLGAYLAGGTGSGPNGLVIRFDPNKMNAAQIIAIVNATGITVDDVTTAEPDLEDVFLEMTSG